MYYDYILMVGRQLERLCDIVNRETLTNIVYDYAYRMRTKRVTTGVQLPLHRYTSLLLHHLTE